MNSFEFLEKLGFSSNEAKVYGTLIKYKVLNGYEIAKLSGVARSLVYEVINRLIAKGAVIRIDGEPNFYKPIEYQDLIRSIKEENEKNIACAERELQQLATENADVDYVMNIVGEEKYVAKAKELIDSAQAEISLSIWRESFEVLRSNIENAISRGVKVYFYLRKYFGRRRNGVFVQYQRRFNSVSLPQNNNHNRRRRVLSRRRGRSQRLRAYAQSFGCFSCHRRNSFECFLE